MPTVLLVRPNDFIADSMSALLTRMGLKALRISTPIELVQCSLDGVVGAVISTAVTSAMPMTFREAIDSVRQRSAWIPLVATTLVRDAQKALQTVERELGASPPPLRAVSLAEAAVSVTNEEVLVLRKDDVELASPATLHALQRHLRGRG